MTDAVVRFLDLYSGDQGSGQILRLRGGSVINVGSVASSVTPPTSVIYTATKGAVDAITRVLAKELLGAGSTPCSARITSLTSFQKVAARIPTEICREVRKGRCETLTQ
jgi:NAD(P)-dependent dehydrogenase (short-subunit alcohol dehydrogenase family)